MGVVYEAFDERLERPVALKLLRHDAADPSAARAADPRSARRRAASCIRSSARSTTWATPTVGRSSRWSWWTASRCADRLARGPLPPGRGPAHRRRHPRCPGGAARPRHRAPRPEAVEHLPEPRPASSCSTSAWRGRCTRRATSPGSRSRRPACSSARRSTRRPSSSPGGAVDARVRPLLGGRRSPSRCWPAGRPSPAPRCRRWRHAVMYDAPPVLTGAAAVAAADRVLHRALAKAPGRALRRRPRPSPPICAPALAHGRQRPGRGRAADSAPRRAAVPVAQARRRRRATWARAWPTRWPARWPASSRWWCARRLKSARYAQPPLDLDRLATDLAVDVVLTGSLLLPARAACASAPNSSPRRPATSWWSHVTDAAPDGVLELHDDLARTGAGGAAAAARVTRARRRGPAPPTRRRSTSTCAACSCAPRPARGGRPTRSSCRACERDAGFAAAWAERGRLERILGKFEDPSLLATAEASLRRRWRSTPTAAPRSTTTRSSRSTSGASTRRWPGCSSAAGSGAPSRTSTRRWSTPAATAACSTPRWRRTTPPSRLDPTVRHQRAAHLLPAGRLRAGARRGAPQQRPVRGAAARRDGPARRGAGRGPRARRCALRPCRCCARSPPACGRRWRASATRRRRRCGRFDERALQRRREAVLRGRDSTPCIGDADARLRRAAPRRGRRLPVCRGLRARRLPGAAARHVPEWRAAHGPGRGGAGRGLAGVRSHRGPALLGLLIAHGAGASSGDSSPEQPGLGERPVAHHRFGRDADDLGGLVRP